MFGLRKKKKNSYERFHGFISTHNWFCVLNNSSVYIRACIKQSHAIINIPVHQTAECECKSSAKIEIPSRVNNVIYLLLNIIILSWCIRAFLRAVFSGFLYIFFPATPLHCYTQVLLILIIPSFRRRKHDRVRAFTITLFSRVNRYLHT